MAVPETELFQAAWYCARTKPKHEHIAAATLGQNFRLEVFHPRLRMERATRRGVVRLVEPVFPGYLFVRCQVPDSLERVRYANGVTTLVRFGERIATVPDAVIEELRECFEGGEPVAVQERLRPGTEVTVAEGPFLGFSGIVVRVLSARQRVQVLLDFLGRTTAAELDRNSLTVEHRSVADLMPFLAMPMGGPAVAQG